MKFGGTSVSSARNWGVIERLVRDRLAEGRRVLVVHSALAGVSNRLEAIGTSPATDAGEAIEWIARAHHDLARDLEIDGAPLIEPWLDELRRLASGVRLLGEATPKSRARILALGELMATSLGAAHLARRGVAAAWVDARRHLVGIRTPNTSDAGRYLNAQCDSTADPAADAALTTPSGVALTQGFIARDDLGDTVVLGRGGSDTSAAYFGAKLSAERVEIWTDVPGMFSANPRTIPSARLLRALDYDEAQEIASTGGKVLHPRCIAPLRAAGIPLWVLSTERPELSGTVIGPARSDDPQVKAISVKSGLTLVSMETMGMWQQVGFLADAFACFKRHGLSVDLVSTSEANVTVTLDPGANALHDAALDALTRDLQALCRVRVFGPCAAVSLVGRQIRAILPRLGPALEVFAEQRVHLVTQAASDLNLTFVVEQEHADRLASELHALLIRGEGEVFGPAWSELVTPAVPQPEADAPWWQRSRSALLELVSSSTPAYVYDAASLDRSVAAMKGLPVDRLLYAVKANPNPSILRRFAAAGLSFECVSPGEVRRVQEAVPGIGVERLLFTPSFAPRDEYRAALEAGLRVTLDGLHPLRAWGDLFSGHDVLVRIDLGHGRGHHAHVRTAGDRTKFGVPLADLDELARRAAHCGVRIVGLHAHAGSGILDPAHWGETAARLAELASRFPDVSILDVGGGFGVPEARGGPALDLGAMAEALSAYRKAYPRYELWIEPGRYLVASAGVLLATVTQVKDKGGARYVGVDAGMNSLIRPALYGAHHEIVNLSRLDEPPGPLVSVVGPICESGDVLGSDRRLPAATQEGDVVLIANAGAYGHSMASRYNLREPAAELWLETAAPESSPSGGVTKIGSM